MTLTRYQPWSLLNQLQQELARNNGAANDGETVETAQWVPAVDIKEEAERYVLHADIPGVNPEDIEISLEDGILTVRGDKNTETRTSEKGFTRVERNYGSFYRRFSLPDTADPDSVSASARNGVLELSIPKREQVKPRKISVNVAA